MVFPLAILDSRIASDDDHHKTQVLVQWAGLPIEETSWEDLDVLREEFPHLNLEDQVRFDGERNVTEQPTEAEAAVENNREEGYSSGRSSVQRIKKKPMWMRDYVA